jgi:hypothetical protein
VVERGPEKAGVGGSIPSLATMIPRLLRVLSAVKTAGKQQRTARFGSALLMTE